MNSDFRYGAFWTTLGWLLVLAVIWLSLTPAPLELGDFAQSDKLSHVLAYAVLMAWFANLHGGLRERAMYAAGFVVLGIGIEFVQAWTGYRLFELADMGADALGVALGWLLAPPRVPNVLLAVDKAVR